MSCDVVVLDDEPMVRELLTEALAGVGLFALEAETGQAMRVILRESGARLLVADKILAKGEDGHVLAREAMRLNPGLRVVYISGHVDAMGEAGLTPRERFLLKPFTASTLVALAQTMIG
jgi:DNA-binding NtrC family response regulator